METKVVLQEPDKIIGLHQALIDKIRLEFGIQQDKANERFMPLIRQLAVIANTLPFSEYAFGHSCGVFLFSLQMALMSSRKIEQRIITLPYPNEKVEAERKWRWIGLVFSLFWPSIDMYSRTGIASVSRSERWSPIDHHAIDLLDWARKHQDDSVYVVFLNPFVSKTVVADRIFASIKDYLGVDDGLNNPSVSRFIENPDRCDAIVYEVLAEARSNILPPKENDRIIPGLEGVLQWLIYGIRQILTASKISVLKDQDLTFKIGDKEAKLIAETVSSGQEGFSMPPEKTMVAMFIEKYSLAEIVDKDESGQWIMKILQKSWFSDFFYEKDAFVFSSQEDNRVSEDGVSSSSEPTEDKVVLLDIPVSAAEIIETARKLMRRGKVKKMPHGIEVQLADMANELSTTEDDLIQWMKAYGIISEEPKGWIKRQFNKNYVCLPDAVLDEYGKKED